MIKINESKRDDFLNQYVKMLNNNGINVNSGQVKSKLMNKFVVEGNIHNLSLRSNYYLAGVAKYYFQGALTKNKDLSLLKKECWEGEDIQDTWDVPVCKKIDILINVLRNAYIDTVGNEMLEPEDFGEMPINELFKKYAKQISREGGATKKKKLENTLDTNENVGNGYTFEIMYSYNDCEKYNTPTSPGSWCITYGQQYYNSYANTLKIHYVIFRKNGWENINRPENPTESDGWTPQKPHDEYGNSLIAMLQSNTSPEPVYITSRWNHGYGMYRCEADHAYSKEEFQQITGVSDADLKRIYDIWQQNKNKRKTNINTKEQERILRSLKYIQMRINSGENPEKLFTSVNHVYGSTKMNKGTFACSADVSDTTMGTNSKTLYFLFDGGKIQFETISTSSYSFKHVQQNNLILIIFNDNKQAVYSLEKHKIISVDGVCYFKRVPTYTQLKYQGNNSLGYFEVKQGMATGALIDCSTMEPIKLPNGDFWYGCINSNKSHNYHKENEIYCSVFGDESGQYFDIVYDLSSMEKFFYNANTKEFINIEIPARFEFQYDSYGRQAKNMTPVIENTGFELPQNTFLVYYGTPRVRNNNIVNYFNSTKLQVIKDGKPVNFYNTTWINGISSTNNVNFIINIGNVGERRQIYVDNTMSKTLSVNGEPIISTEIKTTDNFTVLYLNQNRYTYSSNSEMLIYDYIDDSFLQNVFNNNSLIFNGYNDYFWNDNMRGEGFAIFPQKAPKNNPELYQVSRTSFDNEVFIRILESNLFGICKRTKATWINLDSSKNQNDKQIQINESDIKRMVNSVISILLDKIL